MSRKMRLLLLHSSKFPLESNEMVEGMTGQLELILIATRKGWMAKLGVATNPSTAVFGEKDLERQKKRRMQDKHKKRQRRNQIVKAEID